MIPAARIKGTKGQDFDFLGTRTLPISQAFFAVVVYEVLSGMLVSTCNIMLSVAMPSPANRALGMTLTAPSFGWIWYCCHLWLDSVLHVVAMSLLCRVGQCWVPPRGASYSCFSGTWHPKAP